MAGSSFLQGREQSPQGFLKVGPGLTSTLPERTRRLIKNRAWRDDLDLDLKSDKFTEVE